MKERFKCQICGNEDYSLDNFTRFHLKKVHDITMKEYYDMFLKKENEDVCLACGEKTTYKSISEGYQKYCTNKCFMTCDSRKKQLKESWKDRDIEKLMNARKKTNIEKYGVEHYTQTQEYKDSHEKTCLEKYGVKHNFLTKDCTDKRWETLNNNKEEINQKRRDSWTDEKIKTRNEKTEQTNLERYGVVNVLELKEIQKLIEKTNLEKYGTKDIVSSNHFRKKMEENGMWFPLELKSQFEKYQIKVWKETRKHINDLYSNWNGMCYYTQEILNNSSGEKHKNTNKHQPTIDHKISLFYGFHNNIDPEIIGSIDNLCICSRYINCSKGYLTEEAFKVKYVSKT